MVYCAHIPFQSSDIVPKQQDTKEYLLSDSTYTKVKILKSYIALSKNLLVIKERKGYNHGGSALSLWGICNTLFFFFFFVVRINRLSTCTHIFLGYFLNACYISHTHIGK